MDLTGRLLEKILQQYELLAAAGRWTGKEVPNVPIELFTLQEPVGKGRNEVYAIAPTATLAAIVSPPRRGLVAKRQEITDASEEVLEMIARSVTLDADQLHHANEGLLRPKAYAMDSNTIYIIEDRYDLDADPFIEELRSRLPREQLISTIGRIVHSVSGSLARFHADGGAHRDIKPSNLGILRNSTSIEQVLLTDFDLVSRQHRVNPSITTILAARGAVIGTPYFLPDDYLLGRRALNEFTGPELDRFAFGVTIKMLLSGSWLMPAEAFMETLVAERRRYLSREEHWLPLERALHRIAVKATAKHGAYSSMDEMEHDIGKALHGDLARVERSTEKAWLYRNGETEARRTVTRRWFVRAAVGAAMAVPLWDLIEPMERWDEYQYHKEYAVSLEGLARKAADLNPAALKAFMLKESEHFKEELENSHMRQLASGAYMKIAIGSIEGWQTPTWTGVSNVYIGHMLARLHLHWRRTKDSYFAQCYLKFADHLKLDVAPNHRTGDLYMSTVSRFESVLRMHRDDPSLPLEGQFLSALCAMSAAHNQYSEKHGLFSPYLEDGVLRVYTNQERIWPLLGMLLDPSFDNDMRRKVLQGSYSPEELAVARILPIPRFQEKSLSSIYRSVAKSGVTVLRYLWDGKRSYTQAFIGDGIRRKTNSNDPGFDLPEKSQPLVAQDHTMLMLGCAHRIRILEDSSHPGIDALLRDEVKGGYSGFREEIARDLAIIKAGFDAMERLYLKNLDDQGLPPEYLFMPAALVDQLPFKPLDHDALAAVLYGHALAIRGHDIRPHVSRLLKNTPMNHVPRMKTALRVGTLTSARAGMLQYHGTSTEADRYFDELLERVRR